MPAPRRQRPLRGPRREQRAPINDNIRAPEVRVIAANGDQLGVMPIAKAKDYANERELDLVLVAPQAKPPVCRVLDYSKYRYEQEQKAKAARKNSHKELLREIKLRPKIADHDFQTKRNHVSRFLQGGAKVKVTIMFRGREATHPDLGRVLLERMANEVAEFGTIDREIRTEGRDMTMLLVPRAAKKT